MREAVGSDFIVIYRISVLDLVDEGQTWDEVTALATEVEAAGASMLNLGIGWHEARVPTIVTSVPRAAFTSYAARLKEHVSVPVVATNRINMPDVAESVLAGGADLVSLARPFLADPEWVRKAAESRTDEINTCIACNQACLDHTFVKKRATCLVNPRAAHETELVIGPTRTVKKVAVVGAGPAGLAAATTLADRGHEVELFEARDHVGGQFDIAMRIPGKEEFAETIRYFTRRLDLSGVKVHLGRRVDADELVDAGFTEVVVATGVVPRMPAIPGIEHPMVMTYAELVRGERTAGARVAVVGAGGIGVDVSEFLTTEHSASLDVDAWKAEWGVGDPAATRGGLTRPRPEPSPRQVVLLQRKSSSIGKGLGKTSGWVHRAALRAKGVEQVTGVVSYDRIDDEGLHVTVALDRDRDRAAAGRGRGPEPGRRRVRHRAAHVRRRQRRGVRRPGVGAHRRRRPRGAGPDRARHRRGRGRRGARRQARHPPGHRGRHPHLTTRPLRTRTAARLAASRRLRATHLRSWPLGRPRTAGESHEVGHGRGDRLRGGAPAPVPPTWTVVSSSARHRPTGTHGRMP